MVFSSDEELDDEAMVGVGDFEGGCEFDDVAWVVDQLVGRWGVGHFVQWLGI